MLKQQHTYILVYFGIQIFKIRNYACKSVDTNDWDCYTN